MEWVTLEMSLITKVRSLPFKGLENLLSFLACPAYSGTVGHLTGRLAQR